MTATCKTPLLRCWESAKTDVSFTVEDFGKLNGYTYLGSDNGTIERYQEDIVITCGPYQFGKRSSEIRTPNIYSYVKKKS